MSKDEQIHSLTQEVQQLKQQLAYFQKILYGKKSERFAPASNQLTLGLDDEKKEGKETEATAQTVTYTRRKGKNPVRKPLPEHLERREEILLPEGDLTGATPLGEEVTEVLEMEPAKFYVRRIVRKKYLLPSKEIVIAPLPNDLPLKRSNAGATVLADLGVGKFVDHLPLNRQLKRFRRSGAEIAESTLNGWIKALFLLLQPLYEELRRQVLLQTYLQVDESTIKVLQNKKSKTHQGYMWVYHSPVRNLVLFEYHKGRGKEVPKEALKAFAGHLQTDAYTAYEVFNGKEEIIMLACWAHARRKFHDAQSNDKARAEHALKKIGWLYKIERFAQNEEWTNEERQNLRQENAIPIIDKLLEWAAREYPSAPPKSPIGKALAYILKLSGRLKNYCLQGNLCIDNNPVERLIRPLALGRKNYLFAGNHEAAQWAAMFYSFFGTCQANDINPYEWMVHVLTKINEHPINRIGELLPLKEIFQ